VLDTIVAMRVESVHVSARQEFLRHMGLADRQRDYAALAIRGDGTRLPVRLSQDVAVLLLGRLEGIVLELIGLIAGTRWGSGERRR
jgi:hypothetical protein